MKKLIDHLFVDHSVQLAVFPEFISFLAGRKKIIRIVTAQTGNPFDFNLFQGFGYVVSETSLFSCNYNNSFGLLTSSVPQDPDQPYEEVRMFSIASSGKDIEQFEKSEVSGDTELAGSMLGYPECCVRNVENINALGSLWANFYLEEYRLNAKADRFTNRFPIVWGGISPVGELFPCSLHCKAAIEYSRNMMTDMAQFGLNRIVNTCEEHSKKTVYIHPQSGSISIEEQPDFLPIIFS